jgi:hypothetical protein
MKPDRHKAKKQSKNDNHPMEREASLLNWLAALRSGRAMSTDAAPAGRPQQEDIAIVATRLHVQNCWASVDQRATGRYPQRTSHPDRRARSTHHHGDRERSDKRPSDAQPAWA